MKTLFLSILMLVSIDKSCLKLDVILLVDSSSSVGNNRQFLNDAIENFRKRFYGTDVNVGVVTFANEAVIRAHLGDTIRTNIFPDGNTNLFDGLEKAGNELYGSHSRNGAPKIIILITDGVVAKRDKCEKVMAVFRRSMNIEIFGVQVGSSNNNFLEENCDVFVDSDYEKLVEELKKLDICS